MFNWKIDGLQVRPSDSNKTNVVTHVYWSCVAEDGMHSQNASGGVGFLNEEGNVVFSDTFTEHENLTTDQILGWVWDHVSKEFVEQTVRQKLDAVKKLPVDSTVLPWQQS
jgi:hypothetical protein